MKLNSGSLAFNCDTIGEGNTPAWGKELGQGEDHKFSFEDIKLEGLRDIISGMAYKAVNPNKTDIYCPLGRGGKKQHEYEYTLAGIFDKIFVNDIIVHDAKFILLVVKQISGKHIGRHFLKYNPRMTYLGEALNEDCFSKIEDTLGISHTASWFINDINVKNQDELHFNAYILDPNDPTEYATISERKLAFDKAIGNSSSEKTKEEKLIDILSKKTFFKKNLILTGKSNYYLSHLASSIAANILTEGIINDWEELPDEALARILSIDYDNSYQYTDFIDNAIIDDSGKLEIQDGDFKVFCKQAIDAQRHSWHTKTIMGDTSFETIYKTLVDDVKNGTITTYKRRKADDGKLSINEEGRIVYHMAQTRPQVEENIKLLYEHFLSTGEWDVIDKTQTEYNDLITALTADRAKKTRTIDYVEYAWTLQQLLDRAKLAISTSGYIANDYDSPQVVPHVLLINTINCSEIIQLFGETISALNPCHRGNSTPTMTRYTSFLPDTDYFANGFYVPENVFIIFTMNEEHSKMNAFSSETYAYFHWERIHQTGYIQRIFFGSPGTGKSFKLKRDLKEFGIFEDDNIGIDRLFRTTFHPDSDYSSFVGCYRPTKDVISGKITYEFSEEVFTKAYVKAWTEYKKNISNPAPVFLIIEEINRGNCAQIFGDLFQLLDRNDEGFSEYKIKTDKALTDHLKKQASHCLQDENLCLPPNLNIIATMNTSDQSLFPMDSAFKRRWDWKCIPTIAPENCTKTLTYKVGDGMQTFDQQVIDAGDYRYSWKEFLEKINKMIQDATKSDDKKLGYWFIKTPKGNDSISISNFVAKVVFYLWNDVFKDVGAKGCNPFAIKGTKDIMTYSQFFEINASDGQIVENIGVLHTFMKNVGVDPEHISSTQNP